VKEFNAAGNVEGKQQDVVQHWNSERRRCVQPLF